VLCRSAKDQGKKGELEQNNDQGGGGIMSGKNPAAENNTVRDTYFPLGGTE